ncbi:MAG: Hpt domain-containing protein [Clostridium sp.]|jgi:HPt (histidine-containing phosphotransfer) domain-containing protein|nr:Hpt domain-containing protein [Clostridium sp.]
MNKERYDRLTEVGIQIEEALERFMDSEAMFERFLGKFLEDETYNQLKEALEKGDIEMSIMKSHTLKGVTGNLSMKNLYQLTSRQVEFLRAGKLDEARELMADIDKAYEETAEALKE